MNAEWFRRMQESDLKVKDLRRMFSDYKPKTEKYEINKRKMRR